MGIYGKSKSPLNGSGNLYECTAYKPSDHLKNIVLTDGTVNHPISEADQQRISAVGTFNIISNGCIRASYHEVRVVIGHS